MNKRKLTALILCASTLMSGCSLMDNGKTNELVSTTADDFMGALFAFSGKKLKKCSDIDSDTADYISMVGNELGTADEATNMMYEVYFDRLEYEIDEDSVEVNSKKGKASVDAVIYYVDIEALAEDEDNLTDLDTFIEAMEDVDLEECELTINLELDEDSWLVTDAEDIVEIFFDLATADDFDPDTAFGSNFLEAYEGHTWFLADGNSYTNTDYIDFWGTYDDDIYPNLPELYYEVEYNDELIYTSPIQYTADCNFYTSDVGYDGNFPEGMYTFYLYTYDDILVDTDSCYVYVDDFVPEEDWVTGDYDTAASWNSPTPSIADDCELCGWYDYNEGTFIDNYTGGYYEIGDTVEYDIRTTSETIGPLFYAYYMYDGVSFSDIDISNPYFSATTNYSVYGDGHFYEFTYDNADRGVYLLVVAEDEDRFMEDHVALFTAICVVREGGF